MADVINSLTGKIGDAFKVQIQPVQADGKVTPGSTLAQATLTVADTTVVQLTDNGDGTGNLTLVANGTTSISGHASVTDANQTTNVFDVSGSITVTQEPQGGVSVGIQLLFTPAATV
jgi:hypothetical protein